MGADVMDVDDEREGGEEDEEVGAAEDVVDEGEHELLKALEFCQVSSRWRRSPLKPAGVFRRGVRWVPRFTIAETMA
jgi:hypothetical protein